MKIWTNKYILCSYKIKRSILGSFDLRSKFWYLIEIEFKPETDLREKDSVL